MRESIIQAAIIRRLEAAGWYCVKIIQCNKNGFPDVVTFKQGRAVCIEVKSEKGIVSDLQRYRHRELAANGIQTIIAYSTNDILCLL